MKVRKTSQKQSTAPFYRIGRKLPTNRAKTTGKLAAGLYLSFSPYINLSFISLILLILCRGINWPRYMLFHVVCVFLADHWAVMTPFFEDRISISLLIWNRRDLEVKNYITRTEIFFLDIVEILMEGLILKKEMHDI